MYGVRLGRTVLGRRTEKVWSLNSEFCILSFLFFVWGPAGSRGSGSQRLPGLLAPAPCCLLDLWSLVFILFFLLYVLLGEFSAFSRQGKQKKTISTWPQRSRRQQGTNTTLLHSTHMTQHTSLDHQPPAVLLTNVLVSEQTQHYHTAHT